MVHAYLNDNWKKEYDRVGGIYNYWGALLAVFFSPLVFLREGPEPKDNETLWFYMRLIPILLTACLVILYKAKRLSHEWLLLGTSLLLYTSRAYRVDALNVTQYALSLSIMFFVGSVIPVLRPKYIILKGAYAIAVHLGMHVFYYKQSLAAYAPVISWMAISIVASHTISAVRYYYFKNRYVKRRLLHELLEKVSHRQGQLQRAAAVLQKQNERLQRLIAKKEADKRLLKQQKEQLLQQQDELKQSLQKARQVQYALLLPHASYLQQRFPSSFVLFRAADEVSGDFYLCMHAHGYDWICVGDCTGHGVPGALLSCTSVMVLTDLLQRHKNLTPARLLAFYEERMNRYLHHEAIKLKTGADAGILKISSSGQATFTGRGINLILLRKGILYELRTSRVGLLANRSLVPPDEEESKRVELFLEPGDRLYLFTDGFKDQLKKAKRPKRYGKARLLNLLESLKEVPIEKQGTLLEEALHQWVGTGSLTDDVTAVAIGFE